MGIVAGQPLPTPAPGQFASRFPEGLSGLVARKLERPLCKAEQRSYWHRRPLRAAQVHYAALDAYVLLQVASALVGVPVTEPQRLRATLRAWESPRITYSETNLGQ